MWMCDGLHFVTRANLFPNLVSAGERLRAASIENDRKHVRNVSLSVDVGRYNCTSVGEEREDGCRMVLVCVGNLCGLIVY